MLVVFSLMNYLIPDKRFYSTYKIRRMQTNRKFYFLIERFAVKSNNYGISTTKNSLLFS